MLVEEAGHLPAVAVVSCIALANASDIHECQPGLNIFLKQSTSRLGQHSLILAAVGLSNYNRAPESFRVLLLAKPRVTALRRMESPYG